jgi:hypothetical protein
MGEFKKNTKGGLTGGKDQCSMAGYRSVFLCAEKSGGTGIRRIMTPKNRSLKNKTAGLLSVGGFWGAQKFTRVAGQRRQ